MGAFVLATDETLAGPLLDRRLALLQPLQDLVHHDPRRHLRLAERDGEVVRLAEAHLADHVRQQGRARDLLGRQALARSWSSSRPRCSRSSLLAVNQARILFRARVVRTSRQS